MVRCQTNLGRVVDEFNADCEGDEVEIGFNLSLIHISMCIRDSHRDLMSQAAAEGAMQLAAAMVADAPAPRRKLRREILF